MYHDSGGEDPALDPGLLYTAIEFFGPNSDLSAFDLGVDCGQRGSSSGVARSISPVSPTAASLC